MNEQPDSFLQEVLIYLRHELPIKLDALRRWVAYYWAVWLAVTVVVVGMSLYMAYGTVNKVVLGYAQAGTIYRGIADSYQRFFAANGLRLELSPVSHLQDSVQQLALPGDRINASFVLSGSDISDDESKFLSLGTVEYAPGWLFYRGQEISGPEPFSALSGKRVAIGPPGSFANQEFRKLMAIAQAPPTSQDLLELSDQEAVVALLDGRLDAIWLVDNFKSENVRKAAAARDLRIFSWERADAFADRLPYLSKLKLPAGFFDIAGNRPPKDVTLLGSSIVVLVEANLNPALQWSLILAAHNYHDANYDDLSDGTVFPKHTDKDRQLSPVAERYFKAGIPAVFSYLPLYLAAVWDAKWAWILSFFIFGLPLYYWIKNFHRNLDNFEVRQSRDVVVEVLRKFRAMEMQVLSAKTIDELAGVEDGLSAIDRMFLEPPGDDLSPRDAQLIALASDRVRVKLGAAHKRLS